MEHESQLSDKERVLIMMRGCRRLLFDCKPMDRSKQDRHYAIILTDLEKIIAYVESYIQDNENGG